MASYHWAFPEKIRNPPIEDIDFSSFTTPWISNTKKGKPLDIRAINFASTLGYLRIKLWTPWISSLELPPRYPIFNPRTPWISDILNRGVTDYFWKSPFECLEKLLNGTYKDHNCQKI